MVPGILDRAFGLGGGVVVPVPGAAATAIATAPTGNVMVAGSAGATSEGARHLVLSSLLGDGSLNREYGRDGVVTMPAHLGHACTSLLVRNDGGLMVARKSGGDSPGSILHVDPLGRRVLVIPVGERMLPARGTEHTSLTLEKLSWTADGKIVAAGSVGRQGNAVTDFALARFHPDGQPDAGFGRNGVATTDFAGRRYIISAVLPGTDGRLDEGFGRGGISLDAYGGKFGTALAGALLASGDVVIAGARKDAGNEVPACAVYRAGGALKSCFAIGDAVAGVSRLAGKVTAMGIDACGRPLLAGHFAHSRDSGVGLVRLDQNGALDKSFGLGGLVTTRLSGNGGSATALAMDAENRILLSAEVGDNDGLIVLRMLSPQGRTGAAPNPTYKSPEQVESEQRMLHGQIQQAHDIAMQVNRGIQY
jgi:uncharacterized delta-60 repeat protein